MSLDKPNFDILVVDDYPSIRHATKVAFDCLAPEFPKGRIKYAADPAQAEAYFKDNRNNGKNLLLLSDGNMYVNQPDQYRDTSFKPPTSITDEQSFETLRDRAARWHQETGNHCCIVYRSMNVNNSTPINELHEARDNNTGVGAVNNFDNPILMEKGSPNDMSFLAAILDHCDKLFAVEPTPAPQ